MDGESFALRLSQLREQKGVSAQKMSLSIGQSTSYINKIENKRIQPSIDVFFLICEHLGISEKDFFDLDSRYPENLNSLIMNLKKLDEKALEHISGIVEMLAAKVK